MTKYSISMLVKIRKRIFLLSLTIGLLLVFFGALDQAFATKNEANYSTDFKFENMELKSKVFFIPTLTLSKISKTVLENAPASNLLDGGTATVGGRSPDRLCEQFPVWDSS